MDMYVYRKWKKVRKKSVKKLWICKVKQVCKKM